MRTNHTTTRDGCPEAGEVFYSRLSSPSDSPSLAPLFASGAFPPLADSPSLPFKGSPLCLADAGGSPAGLPSSGVSVPVLGGLSVSPGVSASLGARGGRAAAWLAGREVVWEQEGRGRGESIPGVTEPGAARPGSGPLSTAHKRPIHRKPAEKWVSRGPEPAYFNVILSGQIAKLDARPEPNLDEFGIEKRPSRVGGGVRGEIQGQSRASRNRLLRRAGQVTQEVQRRGLVLSVTLTYPHEFPEARASKRDLAAFYRAFERRYPDVSVIWKLEPQKRGAPHYHLLMVFPELAVYSAIDRWDDWRSVFQTWLAHTWYRIVGSGDERHLNFHLRGDSRVGDNRIVERVRSYRQYMCYVAKYVGKVQDFEGWSHHGRVWGHWNKDAWRSIVRARLFAVGRSDFYRLMRALRRLAPAHVRRNRFVRTASTWTTFDRCHGASVVLESWDASLMGLGTGEICEPLPSWGSLIEHFLTASGYDLDACFVGDVPPL